MEKAQRESGGSTESEAPAKETNEAAKTSAPFADEKPAPKLEEARSAQVTVQAQQPHKSTADQVQQDDAVQKTLEAIRMQRQASQLQAPAVQLQPPQPQVVTNEPSNSQQDLAVQKTLELIKAKTTKHSVPTPFLNAPQ